MKFQGYAATEPGGKLEPFEFEPGPLGEEQVQIKVESCGICHSDLSMVNNEWEMTQYPIVPGHEVVGTIEEVGAHVKHLDEGQRVGLGWFSRSCMVCETCLSGDHHLCAGNEHTIVGRHGGFADRVRAHAAWTIPLPEGIDAEKAGPLFCGGITVFNPIVQFGVKPTNRVGVIGIGGLGHLALQFLRAWGCEVTAFSSSPAKEEEARNYGAHHFIHSQDASALEANAGTLDFILSTANVPLDWNAYVGVLAPRGRLHSVGAVPAPLELLIFPLLVGQKSVSSSPLGSPATIRKMLAFAARHGIAPRTKTYPFTQVNEAFRELKETHPSYRLVLTHG